MSGESQGGEKRLLRRMPSDEDAEKAILSCLMHDPVKLLPRARAELGTDAFYHAAPLVVLQAMMEMEDGGTPIEYILLGSHLRDAGRMEKCGGDAYLAELLDFVPVPTHFNYYRDILLEKKARRAVIGLCTELIERAHGTLRDESDKELDWRDLCVEAQGELFRLTQEHGKVRGFVQADGVMDRVDAHINEALRNKGHVTHGLATGFTELDRTLMGMKAGQLIILAARPAMGKTSLGMNVAECVALANGHYAEFNQPAIPVGVVTLEMSDEELLTRMNLGMAGVNMKRIRDGFMSREEGSAIANAGVRIRKAPIYLLDTGNLTIQELRGLARHAVAQLKLGLLIVDYLQLLKSNTKMAKSNRYVEVQEVSQGLKALAKELRIPIIAIAQVGRKAEEHKGCRPQMGDLRESGDIEQDADVIGLIYRESYYLDCPEEVDEQDWLKRATLIIEKNRNGPVGDLPLTWEGPLARFGSTTQHLNSNNSAQRQGGGK